MAIALINGGADVNRKDKEGKTALMDALAKENENIALAIVKQSKDLDLNAVDNQGQTALIKAAINGMTKVALALIKRGADVNIKDKECETALMYAIAVEDTALEIMENSKDLNLNALDNGGRTALMKAVIHRQTKVARALIRCGADVNNTDKKRRLALMYIGLTDKSYGFDAGFLTHKQLIDSDVGELTLALIDAGADVNKTDDKGNTALIYNVMYDASVKELIERGKAPVDSKNDLGRTALFYALVESNLSARYLVENGANLHLTDKHNISVLSYFIHHCINNAGPDGKLMAEKLAYFNDNGVKKETIVNTIVNAVFCKLPLLLKCPLNSTVIMSIRSILDYAAKLSRKSFIMRGSKCRIFQDLADSIHEFSVTVAGLSRHLGKLLELGADPNTTDEQGNTIAHHITLLGMYDYTVEARSVIDFLLCLAKKGLKINKKNCNKEGPLFFILAKAVNHDERRLNKEFILDMCNFFLEKDPTIGKVSSHSGDSIFHLLIKVSNKRDINEKSFERCIVELLQRCSHPRIVNGINDERNTPLHVWAAGKVNWHASERLYWQGPSEKILDYLMSCGAVHFARNLEAETPLHLCRTWSAVKLLFKAGARTNDVDALGRSPLLSAAKNCLFLENSGCFYPDVSPSEAPTFWKTVMDMGFDLWTCDKNGDSIIGILIGKNSFELADSLIEITCDNSQSLSDKTLVGVLNAICKDESTQTTWKSILVDRLLKQLKSTRRTLDLRLPLRSCCMNIIDHSAAIRCTEATKPDSVHYETAKQLLRNGASGESCLDVAEGCPPVHALTSTPISMKERPLVIPWASRSQKPTKKVAKVARRLNCNTKGRYWYHKTQIELDSVHYEIAKQLLRCGASGESCLDVAEGCPPLQALLSTPVSMEERPLVIPWTSRSKKHKNQLAEVARGLNCNVQKPYWYHKTPIGHGAFGQVFVGVHEKDSMEVAVKRVHYMQQDRDEDIREIRSFASLPKCKHIVRYLTFLLIADYSFIIMELMEGNLIEYFGSAFYDGRKTLSLKNLCKHVALGLSYLHNQNIIHRDLKPTNILYKTDPQICLKIADFGLSRRVDVNASFTVMTTGVGTPGWIAPEVIKSTTQVHSMSSDVFSLGLIFHYILSNKKHPFSPADCTGKSDHEINIATQGNILKSDMEGWSKSVDPESSHSIKGMLNCTNEKERPTASMFLDHPMFWSKKKKLDFLIAVGNQEEFECPRDKRPAPSFRSDVEKNLEKNFATIVNFGKWNHPRYTQTSAIFIEMQKPIVKHDKKGKPYNVPARKYKIGSAVELVRFIRNAIAHVSEASRPTAIRTQILEDAVFLDEFPNLVIEVFKAVTEHGWDVSREEIKHVLANN